MFLSEDTTECENASQRVTKIISKTYLTNDSNTENVRDQYISVSKREFNKNGQKFEQALSIWK